MTRLLRLDSERKMACVQFVYLINGMIVIEMKWVSYGELYLMLLRSA